MPRETRLDPIAATCGAMIVFGWFVVGKGVPALAIAFGVTLVVSLVASVNVFLFLTCLFVPLLPILFSHLLIEPYFSGAPLTAANATVAMEAWLRVGGMALLSCAWLALLDLRQMAQLCRSSGAGQYLLLPFLVAATFVLVTRDRWLAIRELQVLRQLGHLRQRRKIRVRQLPHVGLQLTMASLVSTGELALACSGRGIGSRRDIAVSFPRMSALGFAVVASAIAATFVMTYFGLV